MLRVDLAEALMAWNVKRKGATFTYAAKAILRRGGVTSAMSFVDAEGLISARAYWLLNEAYKHQFCRLPMRTDESKRAALQACALMVVRPFLPHDATAISATGDLYANQQLAFSCASAVIKQPPLRPSFNERLRLYSALDIIRFPALDTFLADANAGVPTMRAYDIELSDPEWLAIDTILYHFEAMARKRL